MPLTYATAAPMRTLSTRCPSNQVKPIRRYAFDMEGSAGISGFFTFTSM
jgi:hypothetical protein